MALGCEVQNSPWAMGAKQLADQRGIPDVTLNLHMAVIVCDGVQIVSIACIGQLIKIDNRL